MNKKIAWFLVFSLCFQPLAPLYAEEPAVILPGPTSQKDTNETEPDAGVSAETPAEAPTTTGFLAGEESPTLFREPENPENIEDGLVQVRTPAAPQALRSAATGTPREIVTENIRRINEDLAALDAATRDIPNNGAVNLTNWPGSQPFTNNEQRDAERARQVRLNRPAMERRIQEILRAIDAIDAVISADRSSTNSNRGGNFGGYEVSGRLLDDLRAWRATIDNNRSNITIPGGASNVQLTTTTVGSNVTWNDALWEVTPPTGATAETRAARREIRINSEVRIHITEALEGKRGMLVWVPPQAGGRGTGSFMVYTPRMRYEAILNAALLDRIRNTQTVELAQNPQPPANPNSVPTTPRVTPPRVTPQPPRVTQPPQVTPQPTPRVNPPATLPNTSPGYTSPGNPTATNTTQDQNPIQAGSAVFSPQRNGSTTLTLTGNGLSNAISLTFGQINITAVSNGTLNEQQRTRALAPRSTIPGVPNTTTLTRVIFQRESAQNRNVIIVSVYGRTAAGAAETVIRRYQFNTNDITIRPVQ